MQDQERAMQLVCPACLAKNRVPEARLHDGPSCGKCGAALAAPEAFALDDAGFDRYVQGTELPVLVDYGAAWCGPCRMMAPQFAEAARRLPDVRFAKVDTEAAPQVSARHAVRSIPTLALYRGGREVARCSGARSASDLVGWVQRSLAGATASA